MNHKSLPAHWANLVESQKNGCSLYVALSNALTDSDWSCSITPGSIMFIGDKEEDNMELIFPVDPDIRIDEQDLGRCHSCGIDMTRYTVSPSLGGYCIPCSQSMDDEVLVLWAPGSSQLMTRREAEEDLKLVSWVTAGIPPTSGIDYISEDMLPNHNIGLLK
jgi:hypothetical protein